MLIPDLAYQLFQNIFQRDDALGAAVLVHHHRHVMVLLAQGAQQLGDLGGAGGIKGGLHKVFQRGILAQTAKVKVLFMYHTDDVVNGAMVNGQTGISRFRKGVGHLIQREVVLHRDHIHAGREDLLHLHIVELNGAADELAFPVGQLAVVLGLADHGHQLTLSDGVLLGAADEMPQQALPLAEQPGQRGEQDHEQVQKGRNRRGNRLRHLLCKALGGHLAKDQNHNGQHEGGHRRAPLRVQQAGEQHCANGCCGNVDDIVADEDGGEQLVVLFRHSQHAGCCRIAVLGAAFQADLVQGRKCGLRGGEKGGKCHQNDQRRQKRNTAIVHKKGNHTQLSVFV